MHGRGGHGSSEVTYHQARLHTQAHLPAAAPARSAAGAWTAVCGHCQPRTCCVRFQLVCGFSWYPLPLSERWVARRRAGCAGCGSSSTAQCTTSTSAQQACSSSPCCFAGFSRVLQHLRRPCSARSSTCLGSWEAIGRPRRSCAHSLDFSSPLSLPQPRRRSRCGARVTRRPTSSSAF